MLDIVLFALTSSPANLPMSPSINEVKSVAMSNVDGVTSNHLLPQMYGTTVLDEDVDLELGDEELELIAQAHGRGGNADSAHSDVFYRGQKRIDYGSFLAFMRREPDEWKQIGYVCNAFRDVLNCNRQSNDFNVIAPVIWNNLRDRGPVAVKEQRGGFTVDLSTGQLTFNR
jgi:hypothetical protein